MVSRYKNPRISTFSESNAEFGKVYWSAKKSIWITSMFIVLIVAGYSTISIDAVLLFFFFTAFTLCFGHSLGMHRRFIHRSYACPKWLEYFLVHLGVLVGIAGPFGLLRTHDMRDWAQRQKACHDYFGHQQPKLKDAYWQLHCDIELYHPPQINIEQEYIDDPVYQWMEKYWMWQQLPWAIMFFSLGGFAWVVWGICARIAVSVTGHWFIGYFAHNRGHQHYHVEAASIQGYNIPYLALITMGENWHNNHHAFPSSAKLGIMRGEWDPGWWMLVAMEKIGLVSNLKRPSTTAPRSDLISVDLKNTN